MKAKLTINLDEISENFDVSMEFLNKLRLNECELRLIDGLNIALIDKQQCKNLSKRLAINGVKPIAIASPIFKWHKSGDIADMKLDSFGINPHMTQQEKNNLVDVVIRNAVDLSVDKIRIFSGLGKSDDPIIELVNNLTFQKLVDADDILFLLENEPVCTVHTKKHLLDFTKYITNEKYNNFGIWLDIANLIQLDEELDEDFIQKIAPYIKYIHVKDFVLNDDGKINYVAAGSGIVPYESIFLMLDKYIPNNQDVIISIETHAKNEKDKYDNSQESIFFLRKLLKDIIFYL
jgi:sugar phosphate isomerase/epimerase